MDPAAEGPNEEPPLGCAGFRKKKIFASKRNEAKRDPFRTRSARSCEKKISFASFPFEFFAANQS